MKRFLTGTIGLFDVYLILSALIPFSIYLLTLAPSVTFFDSGEFLTAAYSLGSAHSPGYPLFLMYAKPFTWLPLGNIAFRINMATAFSSSLACLSVYLLTLKLIRSEQAAIDNEHVAPFVTKGAALSAALLFSCTPRLWLQSNHDKPYPLLAFITSVIFYLLLIWRDHYKNGEERPAYIYACTFLAGLSMALHQTVVLLLPAWFLIIILTDWRMILRVKELILATAFSLLGFSIHLYLPLRATRNPLLNWGDTKTYEQFLWHFLRRGYPSEPHARDMSLLWAQLKAFNLVHEFTLLGLALLIFALVLLWRRQRVIFIAYMASVATFLLVIVGYFNTPLDTIFLTEEFFTPLYLLSAVMIGVGLCDLCIFALQKLLFLRKPGRRTAAFVGIGYLALPFTLCAMNYYENDQHDNYIAYDYATNSLRSLPQNAILFTWGDSGAFPLWYLQGVERMREDVLLPHTPHLVFDWYLNTTMPQLFRNSTLKRLDIQSMSPESCLRIVIRDNYRIRPVFIDFSTRYSTDLSEYVPIQQGLIYRMRLADEPGGLPDTAIWENYNNRGILDKISFRDLDTGKAIQIYANGYLETGDFLLGIGKFNEAVQMLRLAERIAPELRPNIQQVAARYGVSL